MNFQNNTIERSPPVAAMALICSWVAVSGQLNVSSEWFAGLPADRLDILKRTLPTHTLLPRPADLFETDLARIWLLTDHQNTVRDAINSDGDLRQHIEYNGDRRWEAMWNTVYWSSPTHLTTRLTTTELVSYWGSRRRKFG